MGKSEEGPNQEESVVLDMAPINTAALGVAEAIKNLSPVEQGAAICSAVWAIYGSDAERYLQLVAELLPQVVQQNNQAINSKEKTDV